MDKIYALQKEQEDAMAVNVNYKAGKERIEEMIEYLKSQPKRGIAYDEQLVRKLIEKTQCMMTIWNSCSSRGFGLK